MSGLHLFVINGTTTLRPLPYTMAAQGHVRVKGESAYSSQVFDGTVTEDEREWSR